MKMEAGRKEVEKRNGRGRLLSRGRVVVLAVCAVALCGCLAYTWMTADVVAQLAFLRQRSNGRSGAGARKAMVSIDAWQTASTLLPMAVSAEEQEYAHAAERLADHAVDQAFAVALRVAGVRAEHVARNEDARQAAEKVASLEQLVKQDREQVRHLGADPDAATAAKKSAATAGDESGDLELARAQLNLDAGELEDAQRGLAHLLGDNSGQIQEELNAYHQAEQQAQNDQHTQAVRAVASVKQHRTLLMRLQALGRQHERGQMLAQAASAAAAEEASLVTERAAAATKLQAAFASETGRSRLEQLKDSTNQRQILAIYDDRIDTDRQLAAVYRKWMGQVDVQHRILLHLIAVSLEWIFAAILAAVLLGMLAEHVLGRMELDNRQEHTLRTMARLVLQLGCVATVLLILFGVPQDVTTVVGLATAGLTIALQDFVLAFLGWFLLMGRNGIHVGDWVEINSVHGEVVEVGLFSTMLIELDNLSGKGRPTGRRISFLNSFTIRGQYFNFSTSSQWMWDEVKVEIPKSMDIREVAEEIEKLVQEKTAENADAAERDWMRVARGSSLTRQTAASTVSLQPTSEGIEATVHYITQATERVSMRDRLYLQLLELLGKKQEKAAGEPGQS